MTVIAAFPKRARFRIVTYMSTRPRLYYGVRRLSGRLDPLCIRPDTDIVIEGYPRSANSTTVHRFLARQDRPLHVAHHKHHAAQILRAVQWGIPAIVLIREPREACLSLLALGAEARHRAGKPQSDSMAFTDVFSAYVAFYRAVEECLDQIVIGRFEFVRTDITDLIYRVNARFGTNFLSEEVEMTPQPRLG